jgi:hypothetical protein
MTVIRDTKICKNRIKKCVQNVQHAIRVSRKKYNMLGDINSISPSFVKMCCRTCFDLHTSYIKFSRFCFLVYRCSVPGRKLVWKLGFYCGLHWKLMGMVARITYGDAVL